MKIGIIIANDNRLVMVGSFETSGGYVTPKNTRVWWTPVLGSSDIGDAERLVLTTSAALGSAYLDVEAAITGIAALGSSVFVFSYRRMWTLEPTGLSASPYRRFSLDTGGIGCVHHNTIVQAEDENGSPCLYFMSHKGPYRYGANGLQYLGGDNEGIWSTLALGATYIVAHGVYHAAKHQVWWFISTTTDVIPTVRMVFDTRLGRTVSGDAVRRGWAKHGGTAAFGLCSVMFSNTVAASMSSDLKPHLGFASATGSILKCDSSATDDIGVPFQAYVETKEYGAIDKRHSIRDGVLIGQVASGVTVTVNARSDFGLDGNPSGSALLTAAGSETRVQKRLEGLQTAGIGTFAFRIGDASAASNQWTVDAVAVNVTEQEALS